MDSGLSTINFLVLESHAPAGLVRHFANWASEETLYPEDGELPGIGGVVDLEIEGSKIQAPAWLGVRWNDDEEAMETLDQWNEEAMKAHPHDVWAVVMEEDGRPEAEKKFTVWLRHPGITQGVDWCIVIEDNGTTQVSSILTHAISLNPKARQWWRAREQELHLQQALPCPTTPAKTGPRF